MRYIGSFFSIWNLDIFRLLKLDICLHTNIIQTLALDLAIGIYPLHLTMLSYLLIKLYDNNFKPVVVIWKPFKRVLGMLNKNLDVSTSLIDAFATFFLLSMMKLLNVSFDLLAPVKVYQLNSTGHMTHSWRLYYDATLHYFGKEHLPYAITAIVVFTFFVLLPALLLVLYPLHCFQKFLNLFPIRWYILHTFVDMFQGCYKDGTEPGTRDWRWFASFYFLIRLLAMAIGALICDLMYFPILSMALAIGAMLYITIQPFKLNLSQHSYINAMFLLLLAIWYVSLSGYNVAAVKKQSLTKVFLIFGALMTSVTLLYITIIIVMWIYHQRRVASDCITRLKAWRHGYVDLH